MCLTDLYVFLCADPDQEVPEADKNHHFYKPSVFEVWNLIIYCENGPICFTDESCKAAQHDTSRLWPNEFNYLVSIVILADRRGRIW